VKAAESWLLPAGARTTSLVWAPEQLFAIYRVTERQRWSNLMLQEFIDPAGGQDWFYHGYRNARSNCWTGFTGRKLRSYPAFAGPTTLGKSLANEKLRQQAEELLKAISYSGICDLDYRLDTRDGQYKLLDFNPRIGAQFRLFEDDAGVDVARALYLDLSGKQSPATRPVKDRTFIADFHDLAAGLGYFRHGKLSFREWRQSRKGPEELAWFSRDDVRPFLMCCARLMFRVCQRLLRIEPKGTSANVAPCFLPGRNSPSPGNKQPGEEAPVTSQAGKSPRGVQA
jgi:predicted ATP-grasp superfamily ATP-dependent carboligase